MNCVMNGKLDNLNLYKDSHISYAPDDSGVSIGAGLLTYYKFTNKNRTPYEIKENYYGPSFTNKEIENACQFNPFVTTKKIVITIVSMPIVIFIDRYLKGCSEATKKTPQA